MYGANMKFLSLLFFSFISITAFSQEIAKEFNKILFNDDFSAPNDAWSQTFNIDNLFVRQSGTFDLVRKNNQTGYFIIPNYADKLSSYEVNAGFSLIGIAGKIPSAGILMMADKTQSTGILIEINQKREYRICRVAPDKITPISNGKNGWSKSTSAINKKYNEIKVKTHNKMYDLYINQRYITTFTDIELNRGTFGLFIGPSSRASYDFITVSGEETKEDKDDKVIPDNQSPEDVTLTQIIVKLRNDLNAKEKEVEELKVKLKNCGNIDSKPIVLPGGRDTALLNKNKELAETAKELKTENDILRQELLRTKAEAMRLQKFKDEVQSKQSGDIVITLTNLVGTQKEKISELEENQKTLTNDNKKLKSDLNALGIQVNKKEEQIAVLEKKNKELDSLANFYKDILIRLNIDPQNPVAPLPEKNNKDEKDEEKGKNNNKEDDESIDNDYINRLIEREKEERRRREGRTD
jgi:hypothetical protein